MADAETSTPYESTHVLVFRSRALLRILLILVLLYGAWFLLVLFGEQRGWTDDPGAWAKLTTFQSALLGLGVFGVAVLYAIALLVRRDVPTRTYVVPDSAPAAETAAPQFLQTEPETPAGGATTPSTPTENAPPPQG